MESEGADFVELRRQQFRKVFQPSRIVLGILSDLRRSRVNVITLCFDMYCSYKPPMMAFAIHKHAYSFGLLEQSTECVLAIPGERLAEEAMYCGVESAASTEKFQKCGFTAVPSKHLGVPGIAEAIANVELSIVSKVRTGDHLTAFGRVLRFGVAKENKERCLLSVGPRTSGYCVLARKGVHRIAVVDGAVERMEL